MSNTPDPIPTWRELVAPTIARLKTASKFDDALVTFTADGAGALADLLDRMARQLDTAQAERIGFLARARKLFGPGPLPKED